LRVRASASALLLLAVLGVPKLHAQESEVAAAVHATLDAWAAGEYEAFVSQYAEDARGFFLDGGPLMRGFSVPVLQAAHDAGFRADVHVEELDVRVHGDVAMSVGYLVGTLTLPGGVTLPGSWRYSETRVLEDGAWRVVQFHISAQEASA
jgi:uncharacterized protein (TIGR02246 family)